MRSSSSGFSGVGSAFFYYELILALLKIVPVSGISAVRRIRSSLAEVRSGKEFVRNLRRTLILHRYAPSTSRKYASCVAHFLDKTGISRFRDLRDDDVMDYLEGLREGGYSNASLRLHLCAIRAVFDGVLGLRITEDVVHAPRPVPRRAGTLAEVSRLRSACTSKRERAILMLLHECGLRPGLIRDLAFREQLLNDAGKVPDSSRDELDPSRRIRVYLASTSGNDVFRLLPSSRRGKRLSTRTILRIVKRIGGRCGINANCNWVRLATVASSHSAA